MAYVEGGDIVTDATALALQSKDERFWLNRCLTAVNLENVETLPVVWTCPFFTHRAGAARTAERAEVVLNRTKGRWGVLLPCH